MDSLDWNDLRYVVAVAKAGSAAAAARNLGVSHTTVLRRIQVLENLMGAPLFERLNSGYVPTAAGLDMVQVGHSIQSALNDSTRRLDAESNKLTGTIRFTTTDSFGYFVVPPLLASFRKSFPNIDVELIVTNTRLDLDKREADVTLRPTNAPPGSWVGMRLAQFDFGLYAALDYIRRADGVALADQDFVMPIGAISGVARLLKAEIGEVHGIASADTFTGLLCMAADGMGNSMLPRFVGDRDPRLGLVFPPPQDWKSSVWVLTHPHLRKSARIRALMEHLARGIRAMRKTLAPGLGVRD